jgi:hypothetical protein
MTDEIRVAFAGERSGVFDLTWGQRDSWRMMERTGVSMCVGGIEELAPDTSVEDVVATTRFVLERHEALRSLLRFDENGRPHQELVASGEYVVELVDAGTADPAEVAAAVHHRFVSEVFDYERDWPVRMAVVTRDGVLTHAVAAYNHLAADGPGLLALDNDLVTNLLPGPDGLARGPVAGTQPMDQVRRQRSPAGQRQNDTALRYWERLLRRIPPRRFPGSTDPREPRYWEVAFTSPALYQATQLVAGRVGVATSSVLLAALAVASGRYTGDSPFAVQVMVSNRFRPGFAGSVSPLSQGSLCVVDPADTTFDEVVRAAEQSAMKAYLNAYYDPWALDELVAAVARDRGVELDLSCFFNDRRFRVARQDTGGEPPDEATVRGLLPRSTFEVLVRMDRFNDKFFLHVDDVPDVLRLFVAVDTRHLSPGDTEALLRSLEAVVVDAAFDPALDTGVRSRTRVS